MDDVKLRQCASGELCRVATESGPDICARAAGIAARINSLCRSDVYRINDLVRAADGWQHATVLQHASPSRLWRTLASVGQIRAELRNRSEEVHCSSMSLVGWPGAAFGTTRRMGNAD